MGKVTERWNAPIREEVDGPCSIITGAHLINHDVKAEDLPEYRSFEELKRQIYKDLADGPVAFTRRRPREH